VSNRIKVFREARGLSLEGLAKLVGTTNQQISLLETGKRKLTSEWLGRLGSALGCHPWALVSEDLPSGLNHQEIRLLEGFQRVSAAQRRALLELIRAIAPEESLQGGG